MPIKRRSKVLVEFNMSSLTDIVFLLLIFFMLTSSFVAPNAIKLLLPKASAPTIARQTVTVSIDADRRFFVDNQPVAKEQLESAIAVKLSGEENESIVVYADKSVPVEDFVHIWKIGKKLGVKTLLAAKPE